MKYLLLLIIPLLFSCGSKAPNNSTTPTTTNSPGAQATPGGKQLNLTILLDLSDRIDAQKNPAQPTHSQRDSMLISYFTKYFIEQMKVKGTFMSKSKMRVMFYPAPTDPGINETAAKLNIDLSKMEIKEKKNVYETLQPTVASNISQVYNTVIGQASWPGSDLCRFFKRDVDYLAIEKDSNYRNLLVIFTDGYVYHPDSKEQKGNRYSYLLPELLDQYKLRNDNNWSAKIDKLDFGLINTRADLDQLEVLILEVNASEKHKNDEDIIRKVLGKWLTEMKVKKWEIFNSDLPANTEHKIDIFLKE
jgi:hypothetical protein